jgi:hypothetical protein
MEPLAKQIVLSTVAHDTTTPRPQQTQAVATLDAPFFVMWVDNPELLQAWWPRGRCKIE